MHLAGSERVPLGKRVSQKPPLRLRGAGSSPAGSERSPGRHLAVTGPEDDAGMILKLLLLVVAMTAAAVGLIHLALRVLRWTRANRGAASEGLATGFLADWVSDGIDSGGSDSSASHGGDHTDSGSDHH